jgi:hypothetical protein
VCFVAQLLECALLCLFVCLQDELAIIWADLVAKITAANATAIPYCGTRVWRALQGLAE